MQLILKLILIQELLFSVLCIQTKMKNLNQEGLLDYTYDDLSQIDNAIAIPTEALIPEMEGEKVFIYKSGKASIS